MLRISSLLPQFRQSFNLKGKATFWFGGIISVISKHSQNSDIQIIKDIQSHALCQLLQILNQTLASAMVFYPQNPPDNFFKFIAFCNQLLTLNEENESRDFNLSLAKLTLKNSLIVHSLTIKQYAFVFKACQEILDEFKQSKIDTLNQVYLTFFSNFLAILSKVKPTKRNSQHVNRLRQGIEENLNYIFYKILDKFSRIVQGQGTIDLAQFQLLAAIFTKNRIILQKRQHYFYQLIQAVIAQTKFKALKGNFYIAKIYKQKVEKQVFFQFQVPFYEFNHFYQSHNFKLQKKQLKHLSTRDDTDKQDQQKLSRIEKMLQQNLRMINLQQGISASEQLSNTSLPVNRFRKLNYLSQTQKRNGIQTSRTIDVNVSAFNPHQSQAYQSQTIEPRQTSINQSVLTQRKLQRISLRHQVTQEMVSPTKVSKPAIPKTQTKRLHMNNQSLLFSTMHGANVRNKNSMHQVLHFKMGSIFIEVNDDGILLSDYTKENKRYVEWNTVASILPRFQFRFVYAEYLKYSIFNYYDLIRVIKLYLTKNENSSIGIYQHPTPVLQLNQFVKFYPQDGKYTKLAQMNIYDNTKLQTAIDCYFQQFDHFFKVVSTNGYLNYLSSKIFADIEPETNKNEVFYLEVLRKQSEMTRTELENQLTVDIIEDVTSDKNYSHRAIFILKNNSRIYAKINLVQYDKSGTNTPTPATSTSITPPSTSSYFSISVRRLNKPQPGQCPISSAISNTRSLELPYYKILQYIPLYDMDTNSYAKKFGRMIFQLFNNFEDLSFDLNMSTLQFEVVTHYYLTQMIEIGKYFTVVSAELIGTKNQIFGLVVRYNFLPANKEIITFLINPYYGFLANFITLPKDQKRNSFKKLLVNQSVKQTYQYLEKVKKLNQITSLVEYLSEGIGFF